MNVGYGTVLGMLLGTDVLILISVTVLHCLHS